MLRLKIGVPINLVRKIDPPRQCNGIRLTVNKLQNNMVKATIITGKYKGTNVLLPPIPILS